jgi:hypothetical protein
MHTTMLERSLASVLDTVEPDAVVALVTPLGLLLVVLRWESFGTHDLSL